MAYRNPEDKAAYAKRWFAARTLEQRRISKEKTQAWRARYPEKVAQYCKDNKIAIQERRARWKRSNPEKVKLYCRQANYKKLHGISLTDAQELLNNQNGLCLICETSIKLRGRGGAHIDHDHKTNKIRGILCCNCNTGLGHFKDNVKRLLSAARYLSGDDLTLG